MRPVSVCRDIYWHGHYEVPDAAIRVHWYGKGYYVLVDYNAPGLPREIRQAGETYEELKKYFRSLREAPGLRHLKITRLGWHDDLIATPFSIEKTLERLGYDGKAFRKAVITAFRERMGIA